ncbi:DUF742 domain-containing protein [Nonomuraea sp. SBT364]|uniref:DUF742 domain-containing protein n=1 Tax=Nonomuraea sp. SBT364 TaxID=1580530 RepID=UPI0018CCA2EB|nr:DUF742 domain-containing protein [Nonomuraea sp. SBT364]
MIRSYAVTGGDAPGTRAGLDAATLLVADPGRPLTGLAAQSRRVMDLCLPGALSVSEVAAHLQLPGAIVKVIVAGLVDSGHLAPRAPFVPAASPYSADFLMKVLKALEKL